MKYRDYQALGQEYRNYGYIGTDARSLGSISEFWQDYIARLLSDSFSCEGFISRHKCDADFVRPLVENVRRKGRLATNLFVVHFNHG